MGHYFDLLHTHDTGYGQECVDGSNCNEAGDGICDTPADPGLGTDNVDSTCNYTGTETDPCHDDPYEPDTTNYLSYSPKACKSNFTDGQNLRAQATLVNLRPELAAVACGCYEVVYVDWRNGETEDGSSENPFDTILEGVQAGCIKGCVIIADGYYAEAPIVLSKGANLVTRNGPVTIGP